MIVLIDKQKILTSLRAYEFEYQKEFLAWIIFGLKYIHHPDNEKLHFEVVDKDLLLWAMFKYGFEIELDSNS